MPRPNGTCPLADRAVQVSRSRVLSARMTPSSRPPLKRFLAVVAVLLAVPLTFGVATAADPDSGTLSLEERQLTWTGEATGATRNYLEPRPECELGATSQCDRYTLKVDVDPAHWEDNAGGAEV